MLLRYLPKLSIAMLLFVLMFPLRGWGQLKNETITVQEKGKESKITYQYKNGKNGQHLLHGSYLLESKNSDSIRALTIVKDKWAGTFKEGKRHGAWSFTQYDHILEIVDIENFQISSQLSSKVRDITGTYSNGMPADNWSYQNTLFTQGQRQDPLAGASFSFRNGEVFGKFTYTTPGAKPWLLVEGVIGENSLMDGEWKFQYTLPDSTSIKEWRKYKDGYLLTLTTVDAQSGDTLDHHHWNTVEAMLDETHHTASLVKESFGLTFDMGYAEDSREIRLQKTANDRLTEVLEVLASMDTALTSTSHLNIGTARFKFHLTNEDKKLIKSIRKNLDSLTSLSQKVNNYAILQLNHQHTDSLSAAYQFFKMYDSLLPALDKVVRVMELPSFHYNSPEIVMSRFVRHLPEERRVPYRFAGTLKHLSVSYSNIKWKSFQELAGRFSEELTKLKQWHKYISKEIDRIIQSDELASIEQQIQKDRKVVDSVFMNAHPPGDPTGSMIHYLYTSFLQNRFSDFAQQYANAEKFDEKSGIALHMLNMLKVLKTIPYQIIEIYDQHEVIKDAYTTTKFDPYTFNYDFKVIKKKRLYDRAAVDLYNHYLNELRREPEFRNLFVHINKIRRLQIRLLELLEEDTRKLERRIKKKQSPEEIEKLLNI